VGASLSTLFLKFFSGIFSEAQKSPKFREKFVEKIFPGRAGKSFFRKLSENLTGRP
jgi:hypothetical protein